MDKTALFQLLGFECYAVDDLNDYWHKRNSNIEKIIDFAKKMGINFFQQDNTYFIPLK